MITIRRRSLFGNSGVTEECLEKFNIPGLNVAKNNYYFQYLKKKYPKCWNLKYSRLKFAFEKKYSK